MMEFLIYDGKVAVALLVFYLFYRFLLRKETFHRFNRVVLVGTAVIAFLLPLCIITIHKPIEVTPLVPEPAVAATDLPAQELAPLIEPVIPWWPVALVGLFWAGVAFILARVIISILSILRIIRQGEWVREEDGCRIIVTERDIDPFSWMRYIVLSRKDWEVPHESILAHEKAHIGYGHSVELLLVDVLSAFQWFNPAIWMLRSDLQELHEYEADDAVLRTGASLKEYQYLLIRKAVSKSGYSVANSFNHSILKNRITMMSKSKSPLARGLRALYLLPLVCLGIGLQAQTVYVPIGKDSEKIVPDEKQKSVLDEIVVVTYAAESVTSDQIRHGETLTTFPAVANKDVDTPPVFSDGDFSFWLNRRIVFPKGCLYEGTVVTAFSVNEKGKVEDVKVLRSLCEELDNTVMNLVKQSPDWTPATQNGKAVAFQMVIPVTFQIRTSSNVAQVMTLNVRADGTIESAGQVYSIGQLKDIVPAHKEGQAQHTVQVIAPADVKMGVINDVRMELRKIGSLKIRYALAPGQDGITRYMAPFPPTPVGNEKYGVSQIFPGVDRENICVVRINSKDKYLFGNKPSQDDEEMLRLGKDFLREHGKATRFSFQADRGTSYGAFVHMQNLLIQVYMDVRDEKAQAVYGRSYAELSNDEKSEINRQVPISISETDLKG